MQEASVERSLEQAAQHRRMAEKTDDPELKAKLLRIAQSYEEIAGQIGRVQRRRAAAQEAPEPSASEPPPSTED